MKLALGLASLFSLGIGNAYFLLNEPENAAFWMLMAISFRLEAFLTRRHQG